MSVAPNDTQNCSNPRATLQEEGSDPSDAGDTEVLLSGNHVFATRHAAEVAAFSAAYAQIDKLLA